MCGVMDEAGSRIQEHRLHKFLKYLRIEGSLAVVDTRDRFGKLLMIRKTSCNVTCCRQR